MQFYPHDWLSDPSLRSCSLAARGLWIDILCLMWDSPERGILPYAAGKVEAKALAKVVGHRTDFVRKLLTELEKAKVFSRQQGSRRMYSRRMTSEELVRKQHRDSYHRTRTEFGRDSDVIRNDFGSHSSSSSSSSSSNLNTDTISARPLSTPACDAFFDAYPNKLDSKQDLFRTWAGIGAEGIPGEIMAGLVTWKQSAQWQDEKYIPTATKFLRRRQWEKTPPKEGSGTNERESFSEKRSRKTAEAINRVVDRIQETSGTLQRALPPADK